MRRKSKGGENDIHIRLTPAEMALIDQICRVDRRSRAGLAALIISEWLERTFAPAAPTYRNESIRELFERWRRTPGAAVTEPPADIVPREN